MSHHQVKQEISCLDVLRAYMKKTQANTPSPSPSRWKRTVLQTSALGLAFGMTLSQPATARSAPGAYFILPPTWNEPTPKPTPCWSDWDCPPAEACQGAVSCPKGAYCILPPSPGLCVDGPEQE